MTRGILLDIEGTTTPIRFVYETLFPYARKRTKAFLNERANDAEVRETILALRAERAVDAAHDLTVPVWTGPDAVVTYVHWLMDRDRKSTALKRMQGLIWQEGYRTGELRGEVFPDVPPALELWSRNAMDVRIFSSGSVLAQKLLFSTTPAGDLTRFLRGYYDTEIGAKNDPASYARIAGEFGLPAAEILFVSDVTRELDAALAAGLQTLLAVRPGNPAQPSSKHHQVTSLDEILLPPTSRRM